MKVGIFGAQVFILLINLLIHKKNFLSQIIINIK